MNDKLKVAYAAGVIDSDGWIGIKRSTYNIRKLRDARNATYSEKICVKQVEPEAVDLLVSLFGGSRYMTKPSLKKGRQLFTWQVSDLKASAALNELMPYLRIKQKQALNCLALRNVKERSKLAKVAVGRGCRGSLPRPQALSDEMDALFRLHHELNKVGVRRKAA